MPRRLPAIRGQVWDAESKLQKKQLDVSKNRGVSPKMDGENNGKTYFLMIWGENPLFRKHPVVCWGTDCAV